MVKFPYDNFWINIILAIGIAACVIFSIIGGVVAGFFTLFINFAGGILTGGTLIFLGLGIIVVIVVFIMTGKKRH
jgi:hypothetical protein